MPALTMSSRMAGGAPAVRRAPCNADYAGPQAAAFGPGHYAASHFPLQRPGGISQRGQDRRSGMERLDNLARDYPWGSAGDIPEFLGIPASGEPVAELWMGAHPDSPSRVVRDGEPRSLADVIAADPRAELGPDVVDRFGPRLPFLLKVLSAARPLSLQVHPDKQYAERAFA